MGTGASLRRSNPFRGYEAGPACLEWLRGEEPSPSTHVVRLIVNDERWEATFSNASYQPGLIAQVRSFVAREAPATRLIVGPAGMVTIPLARPPERSVEGLGQALEAMGRELSSLDLGSGPPVLAGVDGVIEGHSTPVQTVALLRGGKPPIKLEEATQKVYPVGREASFLLGWQLARGNLKTPPDLGRRFFRTAGGLVGALVCHEVAVFSGRSQANRLTRSPMGRMAALISSQFVARRPGLVVSSIHWVSMKSGGVLLNGIRRLATVDGLDGVTVIPSAFAPAADLAAIAGRFAIVGNRGDVATLLVAR